MNNKFQELAAALAQLNQIIGILSAIVIEIRTSPNKEFSDEEVANVTKALAELREKANSMLK